MVLRCECGGAVEIQDGSDPEVSGSHWEQYECVACGDTGTLTFDPTTGTTTLTGCPTSQETDWRHY